jgi:hypothetical protein
VCIPVIFMGEGFVNTIVKVLVVREDYVTADIVKLVSGLGLYIRRRDGSCVLEEVDLQSLRV